jgi:hypothetical protein
MEPYQPGATLATDPGDLPTLAEGVVITSGEKITLTFPVVIDSKVKWGTIITNTASVVSLETPSPSEGSVVLNVLFQVTSVDPEQNSIDAALNDNIYINLSDTADAGTIDEKTIVIHGGFSGQVEGVFSTGNIRFNPTSDFYPGELIQTSVTAGVETSEGDPLEPFVWEFRAAAGPGPGIFSPHPNVHTLPTYQTRQAGIGDLDGDGDLDVILTGSQDQSVWVNDGSGAFSAHPTLPNFGIDKGYAISLGDIDMDGDLDAILTSSVTDTVWVNNGAGEMALHQYSPEFDAGNGRDNALGDIDGDGDLDVIVARTDGGSAVWINDGKGNFKLNPTNPIIGSGDSNDIEIGDVDNDGDLDVFVAYSDSQPNKVWENDGLGNFSQLDTFGSSNCFGIAVGR